MGFPTFVYPPTGYHLGPPGPRRLLELRIPACELVHKLNLQMGNHATGALLKNSTPNATRSKEKEKLIGR